MVNNVVNFMKNGRQKFLSIEPTNGGGSNNLSLFDSRASYSSVYRKNVIRDSRITNKKRKMKRKMFNGSVAAHTFCNRDSVAHNDSCLRRDTKKIAFYFLLSSFTYMFSLWQNRRSTFEGRNRPKRQRRR